MNRKERRKTPAIASVIGRLLGGLSTSVIAAALLQGCASNIVSQRLDDKVASQPSIEHRRDLRGQVASEIETSPSLTTEQREKLRTARDWIVAKNDEIDRQSLRLKAVLIQDVISTDYNRDEVELIESRLKDLEDQRVSLLFKAVRKFDAAMGHPDPSRRMNQDFEVYPALLIYPW